MTGYSSFFVRVQQVTPRRQIPPCMCTPHKSRHCTGWVVSVGPHHTLQMITTCKVNCCCRQLTLYLVLNCTSQIQQNTTRKQRGGHKKNYLLCLGCWFSQPAVWCQVMGMIWSTVLPRSYHLFPPLPHLFEFHLVLSRSRDSIW